MNVKYALDTMALSSLGEGASNSVGWTNVHKMYMFIEQEECKCRC